MKWRKNGGFCRWLIKSEYARYEGGKLSPYLSEATIIYMFEAYLAGARS